MCICWWKISNRSINYFLFLHILKTKCNRVRERVNDYLSYILLHFKIFKKKNFTLIKSAVLNNFILFTNKCTHIIFKKNYRKVLKLQCYSSLILHVSLNDPFSQVKMKISSTKTLILPHKKSWVIWSKNNWTYWFLKDSHEKSA